MTAYVVASDFTNTMQKRPSMIRARGIMEQRSSCVTGTHRILFLSLTGPICLILMIWLATPDCIHESIGWLVSMIPTATSRSTLRLDVMPWAHEGHMVGHVDVLDFHSAELTLPPYSRIRARFMHEINASMAVTNFKICRFLKFLNFHFSSFAVTPKISKTLWELHLLFLLWNRSVAVTTTGFAVVAWTFRNFCSPILYPEPLPPPEPPPFLHLLHF